MVVTAIGTPVEEALESIGIQSEGSVIHVEHDTTAPLASEMERTHKTDAIQWWMEACKGEAKVNVD